MKTPSFLLQLQPHWAALAPRERRSVFAAGALVCLALLWWLALAPALQTLRAADAQHRELDAQLQNMRRMQAEVQALKSQSAIDFDEALRSVQASAKTDLSGTAQINVLGERVSVTLKNTPADALARWLAQVRINARALPTEAKLVRSPASTAANAPQPGLPAWDGSLVLALPKR
jgi:general secretion pathway protein M